MTVLRLPDELYWDLTPREIDGCIIAHYREQDTINFRFGTIAAQHWNVLPPNKGRRKKMLDWTAFFGRITSDRRARVPGSARATLQAMLNDPKAVAAINAEARKKG